VLSFAAATTVCLAALFNAPVSQTRAIAHDCIVVNGDFEDTAQSPWQLQFSGQSGVRSELDTVEGRTSAHALRITTDGVHLNPWELQLAQPVGVLRPATRYTLVFWARMTQSQQIDAVLQPSDGGSALWTQPFIVYDAWNRYEASFIYPADGAARATFLFDLGRVIGPIWLDDIALCATDAPLATTTPPPRPAAVCRVVNGSFETDSIAPWEFVVSNAAATLGGSYGARGAQAARVVVSRLSADARDVRLSQSGLDVSAKRWVYLDFYVRAESATRLSARLDNAAGVPLWRSDIRVPAPDAVERFLHVVLPIWIAESTQATLHLDFGQALGATSVDAIQLCDAPAGFADEFNSTQLDLSVWQHCKAFLGDCTSEDANASVEWWKPGNATVGNGALTMAFTREPNRVCIDCSFRDIRYVDRAYAGVFIQTGNTVNLRSGYVEARIKTPPTRGLWPAFWLMPALSPKGDVVWPPEIDVLEQFTNDNNETFHTLHYPGTPNGKDGRTIQHPFVVSDEYHVYAINWSEDEIVWYFDGVEVHRTRAYGVRMPMYLILSVGAGGPSGQPEDDLSQANTLVDYVRVYDNARLNGAEVSPPVPTATVDFSGLLRRIFLPLARR
jgi:beta-glucanase (GH16 family)